MSESSALAQKYGESFMTDMREKAGEITDKALNSLQDFKETVNLGAHKMQEQVMQVAEQSLHDFQESKNALVTVLERRSDAVLQQGAQVLRKFTGTAERSRPSITS